MSIWPLAILQVSSSDILINCSALAKSKTNEKQFYYIYRVEFNLSISQLVECVSQQHADQIRSDPPIWFPVEYIIAATWICRTHESPIVIEPMLE